MESLLEFWVLYLSLNWFFYKKKRHLEVGFYDESFLSADLDFFIK